MPPPDRKDIFGEVHAREGGAGGEETVSSGALASLGMRLHSELSHATVGTLPSNTFLTPHQLLPPSADTTPPGHDRHADCAIRRRGTGETPWMLLQLLRADTFVPGREAAVRREPSAVVARGDVLSARGGRWAELRGARRTQLDPDVSWCRSRETDGASSPNEFEQRLSQSTAQKVPFFLVHGQNPQI